MSEQRVEAAVLPGSQAGAAVRIERMRLDVQKLCASPRNSGEDAATHREAANYIADQLQAAGCSVGLQGFTVPSEPEKRPGFNVIGTFEPDHAPFWNAGIPAVMIGDTANFRNPHYHSASDTPDTLDYDLISRVARTVAELCVEHVSVTERPRR